MRSSLLQPEDARDSLKLAEACQCFIKALKPLLSLASTAEPCMYVIILSLVYAFH